MTLLLNHETKTFALQVTCIAAPEIPADLADDWNRLAADMPLRRWEWLAPWWRHYRNAGDELRLLIVRDEHDTVLGIAPWYRTRSMLDGRCLRFLGDNEVCTDYQTLLVDAEHASAVVRAVGEWLLSAGRREWDTLDWRGMSDTDPLLKQLTSQLQAAGSKARQRSLENSWRVEFPGTWQEFLRSSLSRKRREKLNALERKFILTGRAKLHTLVNPAELDEYLGILQRLHQERRAQLGQPGCYANPTFTNYHREVAKGLLQADRLQLQYLELDGTPAAALYCLRGEGGVFQYQCGMDVKREDCQPGWLCQLLAMRQGLEQGAQFWDFLRGNEPYKASWGATALNLVQQRLAAPRTLPLAQQCWWEWKLGLRGFAKRLLGRQRSGTCVESDRRNHQPVTAS